MIDIFKFRKVICYIFGILDQLLNRKRRYLGKKMSQQVIDEFKDLQSNASANAFAEKGDAMAYSVGRNSSDTTANATTKHETGNAFSR